MKLQLLILPILLSHSLVSLAQESKVKRISIKNVYVSPGFAMDENDLGTQADFAILAPHIDLTDHTKSEYSYNYYQTSFGVNRAPSILLGMQFRNKEGNAYKANPMLRVGISYFTGSNLSGNFTKEQRWRYDTLTSSQNGETLYRDSATSSSYFLSYTSGQLRLDLSLIFRTDPEERWSLYSGAGITAGMSFNARTIISHMEHKSLQIKSGDDRISYQSYGAGNSEVIRNKRNSGYSAYIPLGLDFRVGRENEFWKRIHLIYELKTSINVTAIPELRNYTNAVLIHGLGLRVAW
jgi:hypothetical protein